MMYDLDQRDVEVIRALLLKAPLEMSLATYIKIMSQAEAHKNQNIGTAIRGNNHDIPAQPATG